MASTCDDIVNKLNALDTKINQIKTIQDGNNQAVSTLTDLVVSLQEDINKFKIMLGVT